MKKVPARGPRDARILIVGEAPGAQEEREGAPFVGGAGNVLTEMLNSVGIDPDSVFFTNLCKYRPPGNDLSKWFAQDKSALPSAPVLEGLMELKQEIADVKPNVIIPVGSFPLALLTNKGRWGKVKHKWTYTGIGDYRGFIVEGGKIAGGRKCVPTYHPANILREYKNKHIAKLDLRRARDQASFPEIHRPRKLLVQDPRGAERDAWVRWLTSVPGTTPRDTGVADFIRPGSDEEWALDCPSDSFLTADIEYPGNKLICVGFTRQSDIGICLTTGSTSDRELAGDILRSGHPLCFQNGMFDAAILDWFYGIDVYPFIKYDTLIGMHVAYTEFPKDLSFIASLYTEIEYWKDAIDWDKIGTGEQPISDVWKYNCKDVWVTHSAMVQMLEDDLKDPKFRETFDREMSYVEPLYRFSRRGVKINVKGMQDLKVQLEKEAAMIEGGLAMIAGHSVNPRSAPQVAKLLYDELKLRARGPKTPPSERFTEGQWQMNDPVLADLSLKCDNDKQRLAIKLVREARERTSLVSKFCDIDLDDDGRMRCHYDPAKTQTGRLASRTFYPTGRGSNLQNIPRDPRVRAVFVPDDGCVLGNADLKQAESLVVAHISGDPEMLRLHSDEYMFGGLDGHKYVASFLLEKPIELITAEDRQIGKTCRHALNYALGPQKLMLRINQEGSETGVFINLAQAKSYRGKYLQLHPMLQQWWRRVEMKLHESHILYTLHGRPHTFYDRPDAIVPEAIAFVPQGTVADTLNIGLVRCNGDAELMELGYQPLLQVHDSIVFQAPEATFDKVAARVKELLRVPITITGRPGFDPYDIEIPVDLEYGWNWGKMDKPKEGKPQQNPNGLRPWKLAA